MRALVAALLRRLATMIDGPIVIVFAPRFDNGALVKAATDAAAQVTRRTNGHGTSARY